MMSAPGACRTTARDKAKSPERRSGGDTIRNGLLAYRSAVVAPQPRINRPTRHGVQSARRRTAGGDNPKQALLPCSLAKRSAHERPEHRHGEQVEHVITRKHAATSGFSISKVSSTTKIAMLATKKWYTSGDEAARAADAQPSSPNIGTAASITRKVAVNSHGSFLHRPRCPFHRATAAARSNREQAERIGERTTQARVLTGAHRHDARQPAI